ncbi:hypothetical protein PPACK8108_LOCUS18476 [Phakopsora pachyrhizi]|uniref:TAP-C domain-containing protein n=1 Tax=Phakopsora pachyrhizi TaxID=170000 RepID=A0AAV0BEG7_PHAPC|nr:hypothetical protein PPACK8108_LOCUS18476 [Phakopsora pachyrhizi]
MAGVTLSRPNLSLTNGTIVVKNEPGELTIEGQRLVKELMKLTKLNERYLAECLKQNGWNFELAVKRFEEDNLKDIQRHLLRFQWQTKNQNRAQWNFGPEVDKQDDKNLKDLENRQMGQAEQKKKEEKEKRKNRKRKPNLGATMDFRSPFERSDKREKKEDNVDRASTKQNKGTS